MAFLFQFTLGPLAPLYAAEVCTDVALGAVMITEDVVVLVQDFVTPALLDSPMQPVGVFFMFGAFSVVGFLYIYFYVPETKGLSEQEKKEIFMPGSRYGRPLAENEDCQVGWEHKSEITIHQEIWRSAVSLLSENDRTTSNDVSQPFIGERGDSNQKLNKLYDIKEDDESSNSATSHTCTDKTDELDEDFENVPEHSRSLVND